MQVWIGTSGYSYKDWLGPFYPTGTRPGQMLAYYARHFPLVELNYSFYRLPTSAMLARQAEQAPEGFQFLVKMPRSLSHEQDVSEMGSFRQAIEELRRRRRLLGLLCQLPQATHDTKKNRDWLERLGGEFAGCGLAVEFRHRSWSQPQIPEWLRKHDLDLVAVDAPDIPNLFPRGMVQSGPVLYVRFHSRNARKWYLSDKERYDYNYDDQELTEWINALGEKSSGTSRAMFLFNNCRRSQAVANAQRMLQLVRQLLPGVETVGPFGRPAAAPEQQLLFE